MRIAGLIGLLGLSIALPAAAERPTPDPAVVRENMLSSIRALEWEKASRSYSERKVASKLLRACRRRRGEPIARGVAALRNDVEWAADGTTLVDLRADVSEALLDAIEAQGGTIESAHERYDAVRARLPEPAIGVLAARYDVRGIRPADQHILRKDDTSEGDIAHRADDLRSLLSVDGTGLSIGVLSDGVDSLAARQATGDLPPGVKVLTGAAGVGDEGTAMLEIVFDLAPGASLSFATALGGQSSFATNLAALASAGADIIVDDIGYFAESVFEDSDIAAAVDLATAGGVLYFSAAGNDGNENDGSSGVYEADYLASDVDVGGGAFLHDFGGGATSNTITADTSNVFALKWSDPLGGSGNDYDLLLFDDMGVAIDSSADFQDGDDDPYESIGSAGFDDTGHSLGIVKFSGADRYLHLHSFGGGLAVSSPGAIYGHPAARGAVAVAASDWMLAGGASGEFDGSESVQAFSSDGPRRVHYEHEGTPITAGNFSSTGGELRSKPELTGADCVSTATPTFETFCGTSAAAPHAAAIAALLFEAGGGGTTAADVKTAMETSAIDIEAPGFDRDSGHGVIESVGAANVLLPEPGVLAMLGAGGFLVARLARRTRRS
jgi:hypothetical protein